MLDPDSDTGYAVRLANLSLTDAQLTATSDPARRSALRGARVLCARRLSTYRATALRRDLAARTVALVGRLAARPVRLLLDLTVHATTDAPVLVLTAPRGPTATPSTVTWRVAASA